MRLVSLNNGLNRIGSRISEKLTLPERMKGTIIEKWVKYWNGVAKDYSDVVIELGKDAVTKPRKALLIGGISYGTYALAERNPTEETFMKLLRDYNSQIIMIAPNMQNPISTQYLKHLEICLNHNRIRFLSLGILTILWEDLYDKDDCTYPATCEYTKVSYWNFFERIRDIGIWGRFWRLDWKMLNFDLNYI